MIYHTGEIKARVFENNLDDPRLQNLINFGMPAGADRVRFTQDSTHRDGELPDFTVEIFGVRDDDADDDEAETGGFVEYELEGETHRMHVWLRRVRMKGTRAAFEEMWYQPERRWIAGLNYLEHVPIEQREEIIKRFAVGINLGVKAQEAMRKKGRDGRRPNFEPTPEQITTFKAENVKAKRLLDDVMRTRKQFGRYSQSERGLLLRQAYKDMPPELKEIMEKQSNAAKAALQYAAWKAGFPIGAWKASRLYALLSEGDKKPLENLLD